MTVERCLSGRPKVFLPFEELQPKQYGRGVAQLNDQHPKFSLCSIEAVRQHGKASIANVSTYPPSSIGVTNVSKAQGDPYLTNH